MQVALRRRLRWPLPLGPRCCNGRSCARPLDELGDHWCSCMRSGRVRRRAKPLERIWARIFREAGCRVLENVFLRDMGLPGIAAADGRQLEVIATGSPLAQGVPLAVDATMVSPLHGTGEPWDRAQVVPGVSLQRAERSKEGKYPELVDSEAAQLTTLACETGGRWSSRCLEVVEQLAMARARSAPEHMRVSARLAYESRWWAMLSCTQQDTLAATLVDDAILLLDGHDAAEPEVSEVLVDELHSAHFG